MTESSIKPWVEEIAVRLLEGERILIRAAPRIGKTFVSTLLTDILGSSAVLVDGNDFTEVRQSDERRRLEERLAQALQDHGSAQLIFDGYDRALARSQGGRLQARLSSLLIDSPDARDIGALFTARCSSVVHRDGAGSPLMSRVTPVLPPRDRPDRSDKPELNVWFGDAALLIARVCDTPDLKPAQLADRFELDTSYMNDVRASAEAILSRGTTDPAVDPYAARCAVHGLINERGSTGLMNRLREGLKPMTHSPGWPSSRSESVDRFIELVGDATEVIWSDRYMYRDIEPLRAFLEAALGRTEATIYLLGNQTVSDRAVSRAEMARLSSLSRVEARWMTPNDFASLHERHLVTGGGGWVIPQVHVIIGRQIPGSAVAASTDGFGVDYWDIWKRSVAPQISM